MKGRTKNIKFKFYSKYLFVISFLVLAVFLAGCGGVIPPTNQSPTASFTANPTSGEVPLEVSFDASNSTDTDGTIASYAWDFKDGNTGNEETINHTFSSIGSYNVKLTVTDNKVATDTTTKTITVTTPEPTPDPYFPNSNIHERYYYAPSGWCYSHYVGVDLSNRGEPGGVFINAEWKEAGKSYSEVFYMDHNETVIVWLEVSHTPFVISTVKWTTRPALPGDTSDGEILVERGEQD